MVCLSLPAQAKPIVLHGNEHGVWSTSHPHLLPSLPGVPATPAEHSRAMQRSPVHAPAPEPEVVAEEPDTCPTQQSAPHLCQTL